MDYKGLKEELEGFISRGCDQYPSQLDDLISDMARTGVVRLQWDLLKPLLSYRLQQVVDESYTGAVSDDDQNMAKHLQDRLKKFENPPFTIQRICELIIGPQKQYKKRDKFMRAMEKCLMVVSTQDPDLTWMKSPRLTQLLEEPPKQLNIATSNLQDQEEEMNIEQPSSQTDDLDTPKMDLDTSTSSVASYTTTTTQDNTQPTTMVPESSIHSESASDKKQDAMSEESSLSSLPRKRTSSLRDSMDEASSDQDTEMSPVLQEADSTTIGIEHDHPPVFERQNSIPQEDEDIGEREKSLEQTVFKKMKPSSPTLLPSLVGSKVAEIESSKLNSEVENVLETSTDQEEKEA